MKLNLRGLLFFFLLPFFFSFTPSGHKPMKIALTKASPNYTNWIKKGDSSVIIIDLNNIDPAGARLKLRECSGLVLTGGGDIDPSFYQPDGKKEDCRDIDLNRDKLERAMIDEALSLNIPVLGICRGEQMLNVALGGSLITDITTSVGVKQIVTHQSEDYLHCYHTVRLESGSFLQSIIGFDTGFVTSNHHQAVSRPGKGLKMNAFSADGIIEGIEWENARTRPFMVGVQWHPERMDVTNAFSGKLLQRFLEESRKYSSKLN